MRKKNTLSRYHISQSWSDKQVGKYYIILILLVNLFYKDFGMENAWKGKNLKWFNVNVKSKAVL